MDPNTLAGRHAGDLCSVSHTPNLRFMAHIPRFYFMLYVPNFQESEARGGWETNVGS